MRLHTWEVHTFNTPSQRCLRERENHRTLENAAHLDFFLSLSLSWICRSKGTSLLATRLLVDDSKYLGTTKMKIPISQSMKMYLFQRYPVRTLTNHFKMPPPRRRRMSSNKYYSDVLHAIVGTLIHVSSKKRKAAVASNRGFSVNSTSQPPSPITQCNSFDRWEEHGPGFIQVMSITISTSVVASTKSRLFSEQRTGFLPNPLGQNIARTMRLKKTDKYISVANA